MCPEFRGHLYYYTLYHLQREGRTRARGYYICDARDIRRYIREWYCNVYRRKTSVLLGITTVAPGGNPDLFLYVRKDLPATRSLETRMTTILLRATPRSRELNQEPTAKKVTLGLGLCVLLPETAGRFWLLPGALYLQKI